MENNWYQTEKTAEEYRSPEIEPKRRRRSWIPWTIASVAVVALIALSSILFAGRSAAPALPLPDNDPQTWEDPRAEDWGGGQEDDGGDIWGSYDGFMDFFSNYFSSTEELAETDIPRVTELPGGSLELQPEGEELSLQEVYQRCTPSVVGVRAYVDADSNDQYYWGTGVVMSADGIIVTNAHLVTSNSQNEKTPCRAAIVLPDDTEYEALLIGFDARSDIALLKIDAQGLTPAEFADLESMEVGDSVAAIGNPLREEFRNSLTEGIISGVDRGLNYNGTTLTLIQTTTPINEGNSGGPLLNRSGQVIGLTNMKMSARYYDSVSIEGVAFAIPATTIKTVADSILSTGEMRGRPALGLTVGSIPDRAKKQYDLPSGLYISTVAEGSDCKAKGILPGDLLLAVDGESVTRSTQVVKRIQEMAVGDSLTLTIWRQESDGGRRFDVTVTLLDINDVYGK